MCSRASFANSRHPCLVHWLPGLPLCPNAEACGYHTSLTQILFNPAYLGSTPHLVLLSIDRVLIHGRFHHAAHKKAVCAGRTPCTSRQVVVVQLVLWGHLAKVSGACQRQYTRAGAGATGAGAAASAAATAGQAAGAAAAAAATIDLVHRHTRTAQRETLGGASHLAHHTMTMTMICTYAHMHARASALLAGNARHLVLEVRKQVAAHGHRQRLLTLARVTLQQLTAHTRLV